MKRSILIKMTWRSDFFIIFTLCMLMASGATNLHGSAQGINQWSPQQRIPDYGNESHVPCLVADLNHSVHVFNNQPVEEGEDAIYYRKWSVDQGWSLPVDILLSPLPGAPQVQGCFLDRSGEMHLVFFAGNEREGALYYSQAPAINADKATAWSKPVVVGIDVFPAATIIGDVQGKLFILYDGKIGSANLYEIHSIDGGNTWSTPVTVFLVEDSEQIPHGTRLTFDQKGYLHAVWSVLNQSGIGQAIYYARLEIVSNQWSNPIILAKRYEGDYSAAWPAIIDYKGELMVIYMDSFPPTKWMRRSKDGGQTWSAPVRPWQHIGEYEHAVLLVDSNNILHIILGNRNGECCHGMWHGVWLGESWSELEPIVMGPKTSTFDPSAPRAVISQGNVLLVTWWTDTGGGPRNGAWYSYTLLDAPAIPEILLPTPHVTSTPQITGTLSTISATQTLNPIPNISGPSEQGKNISQNDNPGISVLFGILPAALLITAVIFLKRFYQHTSP